MATLSRGGGIAPELEESLHANPLDNNSWQDVTFTNKYDKLLYDSENNVYYGIITSSKGTGNDIGFDLSIYKIDPDMKQETLLVDTGYLSYNYVSYFIDAVYSNYEKKIILLIHTTYTVEGEDNNTYFYLVRYDPLSSDTSSLTNHNYWTKQYISGSTVYDEWYDYENEEFISTSTDMYYPDRMFVTDDGYVVFLCHSPRYAIFIYSIDNMIHRDDFYFTYEIGDWENYYDEYVRDTTITTEVNISVAESKNYIAIGIGYRDDYEPMSLADSGYVPTISSGSCAFIFDKTNNSLTTLSNMYSDWDETENVPTPNMSCIDFENNKFLLSTVQFSSTSKVYEIVANTAVDYNTGNNKISLNAFLIGTEVYTLAICDYNVYIRKGYTTSSIFEISTYNQLTNISCNDEYSISNDRNQLNYKYKTILIQSGTGNNTAYWLLSGNGCLPIIDEEGMNAFIKIKN